MRLRELDLKCRETWCVFGEFSRTQNELLWQLIAARSENGQGIAMVRLKSYAWKRETHAHTIGRKQEVEVEEEETDI